MKQEIIPQVSIVRLNIFKDTTYSFSDIFPKITPRL